jgi:hypothetical protein
VLSRENLPVGRKPDREVDGFWSHFTSEADCAGGGHKPHMVCFVYR